MYTSAIWYYIIILCKCCVVVRIGLGGFGFGFGFFGGAMESPVGKGFTLELGVFLLRRIVLV